LSEVWVAECGPPRAGLPRRWICISAAEALLQRDRGGDKDKSVRADKKGVVSGE